MPCRVEEISLLTTVMVRMDGSRVWVPNGRLSSDALLNISRSEKKCESIRLMVDMGTTVAVVERLTQVGGAEAFGACV